MTNKVTILTKSAAMVVMAVGISACNTTQVLKDDVPTPATYYQAHPITVTKGTVKLQIDARHGRLNLSQKDKVIRFAQDARAQAVPHIVIRRPRNVNGSSAIANEITELMIKEGVDERAFDYVAYNGRGPVEVSFRRHFASSPECGDWSEDVTDDFSNRVYPDFGCSTQHNLVNQVANPADLVKPRTSTPADATRRARVFELYRDGEDTASQDSQGDDVSISDAVDN